MRLIANYAPLGGVSVGDEQMLWGTLCAIENVGSEDSPKLVYVAEAEKAEADEMIASGRFHAADVSKGKASKAPE